MDITPYVDGLRRDLIAAAEAGGPEVRAAAERLTYALDPSARLALMEAISQATAEITAEMPTGSVDVRLSGRELDFVVDSVPGPPPPPLPPTPPAAPTAPAAPGSEDGDDSLARITLRLPESIKARAEAYAGQSGSSLNTWLISVIRAATSEGGASVEIDLTSIPFLGGTADPFANKRAGSRRMTGWV